MRSAACTDGDRSARAAMIPVVMKKLPRILDPALEIGRYTSNSSGSALGNGGFQHYGHAMFIVGRGLLPAARLGHRSQLLRRIAHHYALAGSRPRPTMKMAWP